MAIITTLEIKIDSLLASYVTDVSSNIASAIVPIALTAATIYILIIGYNIATGAQEDSIYTALWKFFKIAFGNDMPSLDEHFAQNIIHKIIRKSFPHDHF